MNRIRQAVLFLSLALIVALAAAAAPPEPGADPMPMFGTVKSTAADRSSFVLQLEGRELTIAVNAKTVFKLGTRTGPSPDRQAQASWIITKEGTKSDFAHVVVVGNNLLVIYRRPAATEVQQLEKEPLNQRVESKSGLGGIHLAAANGDLKRVKALIEEKPQLANSMDYFRWMRLQPNGTNFPVRLRELLLANKMDENPGDEWLTGPLHVAAIYGQKEVAGVLLAHGANPNANDGPPRRQGPNSGVFVCGKSPLHWAAVCGRKEVAELLLAHEADINCLDQCGRPPIYWAVSEGNDPVVALLAERGAKLDFREADGWTLLHLAAYVGNPDVVKTLLANKLDPKTKDTSGKTPLDIAAAYTDLGDERKETARLLGNPTGGGRK